MKRFLMMMLFASTLGAQTLERGDIVMHMASRAGSSHYLVDRVVFDPETRALRFLYSETQGASIFQSNPHPDHLIARTGHDLFTSHFVVVRRWRDGRGLGTFVFDNDGFYSEILPTRAGTYLVQVDSFIGSPRIIEFDSNGTVVSSMLVPEVNRGERAPGADHIELLSDPCTLLYVADSPYVTPRTVYRVNLCTQRMDAPFTTINDNASGLNGPMRQLPNGDVLFAMGYEMRRYSVDGALLERIPFDATQLALTPDGKSVWTAGWLNGTAVVRRFDNFDFTKPAFTHEFWSGAITGLAVVDEWRAGASAPRVNPRSRSVRK